jgi:DNA-binding response OmpR family regulator
VLIVSGKRSERDALAKRLDGQTRGLAAAGSAQALAAVHQTPIDLALIAWDLPDGPGLDLVAALREAQPGVTIIMLATDPTVDDAVRAMRSGVLDLVAPDDAELPARVRRGVARARLARQREQRIVRLRRVCHRLNSTRQQVTEHVGSLCNDLVNAYQELADHMSQISIASEFESLIRQELDVEELLRTVLEYVLAKAGPTNAAIFLPATSSDYSLGAYINYSCPKESADMLLDHLAGLLPPAFEDEQEVVCFETTAELADKVDDELDWMDDSRVIVFNCMHDGECLAVVTIFRDRAAPFPDTMMQLCATIRDLFASQLARVIRIHHRHLPKNQWNPFGESDEDFGDIDLAA